MRLKCPHKIRWPLLLVALATFSTTRATYIDVCNDIACSACDETVISCSGLNLDEIPDFGPAETVTQLLLDDNNIEELKADSFKGFPNLKTIKLNNNKLKMISEETFQPVKDLSYLDLGQNGMVESMLKLNLFKGLHSLSEILLSDNQLTDVPDLTWPDSLHRLILDRNPFTSTLNKFPDSFKKTAKTLQWFSCSGCGFKAIVDLSSLPSTVSRIFLDNCDIKDILDDSFRSLTSLQILHLNQAKPNSLKLQTVLDVDFTNTKLNIIYLAHVVSDTGVLAADAFKNFNNVTIEKMYMQGINVTTVDPVAFMSLTALKEVNLEMNRLKTVPRFPNTLTYLALNGNHLDTINGDAFLNLPRLRDLMLQTCNITVIDPLAFEHLDDLRFLDLSLNKLKTLPHNVISRLRSLHYLDLGSNQITVLDQSLVPAFQTLTQLRSLTLSTNGLLGLPTKMFDSMVSLHTLDLSNNNIAEDLEMNADLLKGLVNLTTFSAEDLSRGHHLQGGKLRDLPHDFFQGNPLLATVRLDKNNFPHIPTAVGVNPNGQLKFVYLRYANINSVLVGDLERFHPGTTVHLSGLKYVCHACSDVAQYLASDRRRAEFKGLVCPPMTGPCPTSDSGSSGTATTVIILVIILVAVIAVAIGLYYKKLIQYLPYRRLDAVDTPMHM